VSVNVITIVFNSNMICCHYSDLHLGDILTGKNCRNLWIFEVF